MTAPRDARLWKIGEAARALGVERSVLRFWESEFPQLVPVRTEGGQRLYTDAHLDLLREIKRLLHEEKRTIQGARLALEPRYPSPRGSAAPLALLELSAPPLASPAPPRAAPAPPVPPRPARSPSPRGDLLLGEIASELRAIRRLLEDD